MNIFKDEKDKNYDLNSISKAKKREIENELVFINLSRIKTFNYILLIIVSILLFIHDYASYTKGLFNHNPGFMHLFLAHVAYIINLSMILVFIVINEKGKKKFISGNFIQNFFSIVLLFNCLYATFADLQIHGLMTIFVMAAFGLAIMIYLKPFNSVVFYSIYLGAFFLMIILMGIPFYKLISYFINSTLTVVIALLISMSLFRLKTRDLIRNIIIKQQNENLESKNQELHKLSSMKDNFVAIVNHDLKNIMGSIASSTKFLLKRKLPDNFRDYITVLNKTTNTLLKLSDDFLQVSLFQSGRIKLNLSFVNIKEIIEDVIKTYEQGIKIEKKNIIYNVNENLNIRIDREKMFTVFSNLVSNALKFTASGGEIIITCLVTNGELSVHIVDNGIGIPGDKLTKIFHPYEKVSIKNPDGTKSTGLGLAICKHIIALHNGQIMVESQIGKGSDFFFSIPVYVSENEEKHYYSESG